MLPNAEGKRIWLQAGATRLSALSWGSGPSVLCLHATGHDGADFAAFAQRVAARWRVIALDWPGHGASPDDGAKPRASHYAALALQACDALALDRPILIGNSIGGAAAIEAAAQAPQRFSGLVLCNPGGLAPIDSVARFAIGRMVAFFEAGARGARWYKPAFRAYYEHVVLPRAPAARREAIIARAEALAPMLAQAWRGFAEAGADLRETAARLNLPVWCAWARGDPLVSWGRSKAAVRKIPDAHWTLFRGGHAAFLEDPDRFALEFAVLAGTAARSQAPDWRLVRA